MQSNVALTLKSANVKTGPIPVSITGSDSCPPSCPFSGGGCYAKGGPLAIHWRKVSDGSRGGNWSSFCDNVAGFEPGQLWRHNQAGDLIGHNNEIDAEALSALVQANIGKRGFTYTHKPVIGHAQNAEAVKNANAAGFTVNLSADNLTQADELAALNIGPVVTILPENSAPVSFTPAGRKIVVCPAQQRDDDHDGARCAGRCEHRHSRISALHSAPPWAVARTASPPWRARRTGPANGARW